MGHQELTDSCGICGEGYNAHEEVWAQYNWNVANTSLCPECSQKIQWPNIPIYRVRILSPVDGEVVDDRVTIDDWWLNNETIQEDDNVQVTIIAPPMFDAFEYQP